MMQATLREPLFFEGVGLHTGAHCRVELRPAQADAGLYFLTGGVRIPATVEYVVDTTRATVLGRDGVSISTTEHLLSALFAMGIANCEILVDGPEIPVCDGSAAQFVAAIDASGVEQQPRDRRSLELAEPLFVRDGDRLVAALPASSWSVRFMADFPEPIGTQYFSSEIDPQAYREEIAGARTFGYLHEVQALLERGLARGGSLDNALVFAPDGPMQPLRWPNEAVRHKVLDLIGDLALLGAWPQCEIVAVKSGHELHCTITNVLRTQLRVLSA
ncbi:MAG TPA: UDP-3-O-acyl-N-acetylglucosamine deacetylase [Candidatus Cybelea sp.]|jgi:UDP-3-O-[3-hydroxymyristoyl] N-acetylglucosamine deacetylase|nr:UDP-3-O-acyl-N-acetylglucosamine deacetylase [Candidatus Cybelea sp.]